ncbi:S1 family peptidase [Glycocaulis alkaliphilus]|nr:serine protease [Glycocaulis alkaliphilus]GGB85267.1 hypothetical protein GCM10007417_26620 [Glycocaulis alkaliphilus]
MQSTIVEQLLHSTVKLTTACEGKVTGSGTGFFVRFARQDNGSFVPAIVTNKHVVNNKDRVIAVCHLAEDQNSTEDQKPSGKFVNCIISIAPEIIINHPDPNVDLCAVPITGILSDAKKKGTPLFVRFLDLSLIPAQDDWQYFDALEEVLMIGCPNGIYDKHNNLPIIRRGITATPVGKRYEGRDEFMVDMACFPGSSGSPIFLYNQSGYFSRKENATLMGAARLHIIGVLYAGPLITNEGSVILSKAPRFSVGSMMHLGNAIRSSELHVLDAEIKRLAGLPLKPEVEIGEPESFEEK